MNNKHIDERTSIHEYASQKILVHCPECNQLAQIDVIKKHEHPMFAPRRLSCIKCGFSKDWHGSTIGTNNDWDAIDPYFLLPLWLQIPCCGHILWAYNGSHLEELKTFIQASLRERRPDETYGWANSSYFSRLPKWIKLGINRTSILKSIKKLELKINE